MLKKIAFPAWIIAGLVLLSLLPVLHALLLVVNFLLHAALLVAQWIAARWRALPPAANAEFSPDIFVSIHVPACNEPPEVLIATLRSLARLDWDAYEVLVIDNNTSDPAVWRPVEEACRELGPRFRFFHEERMSGFKAGALNHVRRFMDPRAEFILVVDADYQLHSEAIRRGLRRFVSPEVALVQFPQTYRNAGASNIGVTLDFQYFFSAYMTMASRLQCAPSTGTLSFIRASALREIGGFDERVITEDAELGLRFNLSGYRSVYVHASIGEGLMPFDLGSLKKQRWRWAFGNAQILKRNFGGIVFSQKLSVRQKVACLTHLTAWFNFTLLPCLSLLLLSLLVWFGEITDVQVHLVTLSGFTLMSFFLCKLGGFLLCLWREGYRTTHILGAFCTHLGLWIIFATCWVRCIFQDRAHFIRTDKFLARHMPAALRDTQGETLVAVLLWMVGAALFARGFFLGPIGACVMGCAAFSIHWVRRQMRATHDLSLLCSRDLLAEEGQGTCEPEPAA